MYTDTDFSEDTDTAQSWIRSFIWLAVVILLWWLSMPSEFQVIKDYGLEADWSVWISAVIKIALMWLIGSVVSGMFFILPEWERLALLRLGRFSGIKGPGMFIVLPFIYSIAGYVDTRLKTEELDSTVTLTSDNVPATITAFLEYQVNDVEKALVETQNYSNSIRVAAYEALKNTIGGLQLAQLLSEREQIAEELRKDIDEAAERFGVDVKKVRLTDVQTPEGLIEELAVIARAERAAIAKGIQGEAEVKLADDLAKAAKTLAESPGGMTLRQIQLMAMMAKEESSTIILYPFGEGLSEGIAAATAGAQTLKKEQHKHEQE